MPGRQYKFLRPGGAVHAFRVFMAVPSRKPALSASAPTEAFKGEQGALLLIMTGLREQPVSGRLLRGLAPYLDQQDATDVVLLTERRRREPWSGNEDVIAYQEVVHWARGANGGVYRGAAWKGHTLTRDEILPAFEREPLGVVDWAARRAQAAVVSTAEPIALAPCIVPKPWGREIWYTGIEARGRASVRSPTGQTELPYALGIFPVPIVGEDERPPLLLKALDPLPQEVVGDLYLEVHQEKWEVYVVLDVDRTAWPNGVGRLRAGLAPVKLEQYRATEPAAWQERIAADLAAALKSYEKVRRRIDALNDAALRELGRDPTQGIPPELRENLARRVPEALQAEEAQRRREAEAFLGEVAMPEGAVACLRPRVLHSLQHGVKVIEFQTPTYERLIAMFAQKVLTQDHWDIDAAVALMEKTPFTQPPLRTIQQTETARVERVVEFPDFIVDRLILQPGAAYPSATAGDGAYQLLVGTRGNGAIALPGGQSPALRKEAAYLMPATLGAYTVQADTGGVLEVLIAQPNRTAPLRSSASASAP